ncbi:MAG: DUF3796 domain-containing protein [Candidatus Faecousia sp.]|nr:DUF3796 domain-containing protein [Candidatus Faecousia sp.]
MRSSYGCPLSHQAVQFCIVHGVCYFLSHGFCKQYSTCRAPVQTDGENSRQAAWIFRVAGLFRLTGLLGLPADRGSFPFAFFLFFGFFGFFFEGRMSHALIDKRCTENCAKAQLTVDISRTVEAPIEEIFIFE